MNVRYGAEIAAAATAHHLDPRLLAAVAAQETGGPGSDSGRNIVGDGGHGHGVFQIDDRTWPFARTAAAMDPAKNAGMAASILADNLQRYGGDVHAALSAYNTGSPTARGTTTTWADGRTLGYADSVMRHYGGLEKTHAHLIAESRETAASVNALAAFGAARRAPAAAIGMPHGASEPAVASVVQSTVSSASAAESAAGSAFAVAATPDASGVSTTPYASAWVPSYQASTAPAATAAPVATASASSAAVADLAGADADSRLASMVSGGDDGEDEDSDD